MVSRPGELKKAGADEVLYLAGMRSGGAQYVTGVCTLSELSADWGAGELYWADAYPVLLDLLASVPVESVVERLPEELRLCFESALVRDFDNETPSEDIVWIDSARGDHPAKGRIVAAARAWIASKRG